MDTLVDTCFSADSRHRRRPGVELCSPPPDRAASRESSWRV